MIKSSLPFDAEAVSTFLHGDCLELMREIPDGSVDMVFCDLPYGLTDCAWDKEVLPFADIWAAYKRIVKKGGAIVLTASQPFTSALIMSNVKMLKYCWVWEKNISTRFLSVNTRPLLAHEDVCVFADGAMLYNPQLWYSTPYKVTGERGALEIYNGGAYNRKPTIHTDGKRYPRSVIKFNVEHGLHPTQKPVALVSYMIKTYTNPGDLVLDNCAGSGTTGVACAQTGRRFIGMELDADYYQTARDRINHALSKRRNIAKFNKGLTS